MLAVIHQVAGRPGVGMLPVAGRPLVARQLQWLRAAGCDDVAVEIGADSGSGAVARWLAGDALGAGARCVLTPRPVGAREVARRAGVDPARGFVAVPADVLGDVDLTELFRAADGAAAVACAAPPEALRGALRAGCVAVWQGGAGRPRVVAAVGWAARLRSLDDALALGAAALRGAAPGVQVHAAQTAPGVWIGRGARVAPGAVLRPPVLVGAGAVVEDGAVVGPGAILGEDAVVERGAVVVDALVADGTLVGDGLDVERCAVRPSAVLDLGPGGGRASLHDPLLLGRRAPPRVAGPGARLAALALLGVLAPVAAGAWAVRALQGRRCWRSVRAPRWEGSVALRDGATGVAAADLVPRLADVVAGRRALVGALRPLAVDARVSEGLRSDALAAPYGAFDVLPLLVPADADAAARCRALAWYGAARGARVTARLVARFVARWLRPLAASSG